MSKIVTKRYRIFFYLNNNNKEIWRVKRKVWIGWVFLKEYWLEGSRGIMEFNSKEDTIKAARKDAQMTRRWKRSYTHFEEIDL